MPRVAGSARATVLTNSSDDEAEGPNEQQDEHVYNSIFQQYISAAAAFGDDVSKDQVFGSGLARVRDCLSSCTADSSCCLICLAQIRPTEAVWQCEQGCYAVLHLVCLQEWARNQLDAAAAKVAARMPSLPNAAADARAAAEWGCPKCRTGHPASEIPKTYTCYCGKAVDPEFDPWVAPHTCGEVCGKKLPGGCGHNCLLLCHPGPCPPCPLVVDARCYCGSASLKRRCGHFAYSCDSVCNAMLDCGHRCPEACHPGDCPPCQQVAEYRCRCGVELRRLPCSQRDFACKRLCGRPLPCGNHKCEQVCHSGVCGDCPHADARTCPCGKVSHVGMTCLERAPTCGGTCGKLLKCGLHRCTDRCHYGECTNTCRELVTKTCRCGKMQREVPCHQEFTCERRCNGMRACGRHPCKRRCCDGACPPCEEACNRKLKCGNHKCPAPCHSGPCRPCPLTVTFSCACSGTTSTLPCGAESRAVPPHCFQPCPVQPLCRHAAALPRHRCHFGPCPRCTVPCLTPLPCGHTCNSQACHDPPPQPIAPFKQPPAPKANALAAAVAAVAAAGAGGSGGGSSNAAGGKAAATGTGGSAAPVLAPSAMAAQAAAAQIASLGGRLASACPPCSVLLQRDCLGGHVARYMACHEAREFSCGAACGRSLACGNHACALPCHKVAGQPAAPALADGSAAAAPVPCQQCTRRCERQPPAGCTHVCPLACHSGPCPACTVPMRSPCYCGKTTLQLACHESRQANAAMAAGQTSALLCCGKPCHRQLPYCPHPCKAACHRGTCPDPEDCPEEVTVRCECKRQKAKWRCGAVQAALEAEGRGRSYTAATQLRLLQCDAECERAKQLSKPAATEAADAGDSDGGAAKGGKGSAVAVLRGSKRAAKGVQDVGPAAPPVPAAPAKPKTRAEREAEREAERVKREAERLRRDRMQGLLRGLVLGSVVLVGLMLAIGVKWLLAWLDASAHATWGHK